MPEYQWPIPEVLPDRSGGCGAEAGLGSGVGGREKVASGNGAKGLGTAPNLTTIYHPVSSFDVER